MLADEKLALERELSSIRKMFTEWDTSSSKVMVSAVAHAAGLLKSHMPGLDLELLHEDYRCESDAFDAAQHFLSSYGFSMIGDQSSPSDQS
jgi:hypothetical protein